MKSLLGLPVSVCAAIGLSSLVCWSQSIPGTINTGTAGDGVVYVGAHAVGPGTNASTPPTYTVINVSGKAQLNYLILTNGIGYYTNIWPNGPTGAVSMALSAPYDLNYASFTACKISGITGKSNQITSEKLLSIQNLSATNFEVTLDAGFADGNFVFTHTVTNGTVGMFWLRYTPQPGRTNCVFRQL